MTLIVDSGGLLAAMDDKQRDHEAFRNALEAADGPRIIEILTTDQRDFREVTGSRNRHFRILPYDQ